MIIILETTLPPTIKRGLGNYLSGRQTYVTFRNINPKYRRVKQGVPQGGVLSPIHVSIDTEGIKLITYTDDCTLLDEH